MRCAFKVTIFAAAIGLAACSLGQTINLATGQDASGNIQTDGYLADANWQVTNGDYWWNGSTDVAGGSGNAWTVTSGNPDWYGGWFANGPNSSWIASDPNTSDNGNIILSDSFTLTAAQVADASIGTAWQFAIDDQGSLELNGNVIGTVGDGAWGAFTAPSVSNATILSDLVVGTNTLTMVDSSDHYLEAGRFEGTLDVPSGSPEPFTMAIGAAGIGIAIRRKFRVRRKA